jgi:predicted acyltransferase
MGFSLGKNRFASAILRAAAPSTRLLSLDVFRGLTMAAMVVVNNPGDWNAVYWPLLHAQWHGWTPTDLVFPFFLFIVGVSITLSRKSASPLAIGRRAVIIFALGLFLNAFPGFDLPTWRIPGVLQRIAVCYLVTALLHRATTGSARQVAVLTATVAGLVIGYWLVMIGVAAPGGVRGDLSPEGNVGAWLDRALMSGHLWQPRWDPEGVLSTLPAIATAVLGVIGGLWIGSNRSDRDKTRGLILCGLGGVVAGYLWNVTFPINKALWTSSYVLLTAGLAALVLAVCYWTIDIRRWRGWTTPLVILGSNAIALYVLSSLLASTLEAVQVPRSDGRAASLGAVICSTVFAPLGPPKVASLLYALAHLAGLYVVLGWMYRRRILLRV